MLKLSIITINYNNLEGLKRTVESVTNQTWKEFEYIVIDGSSTDGSVEYLQSQTTAIDYWISEPDSGIYNAMNKGIVKATGEYLLFLNSGDHFCNCNILELHHIFLLNVDLIYFNVKINDMGTSRIISYPNELRFSFFMTSQLCHQVVFTKKELFYVVGLYDENLSIVSDWKFMILALFKYNCSYIKIDEILSTFYLDGISSKIEYKELILKEREEILRHEFAAFIDDTKELNYLRTVVSNLRKSRKIKWLIKFGLIDRF